MISRIANIFVAAGFLTGLGAEATVAQSMPEYNGVYIREADGDLVQLKQVEFERVEFRIALYNAEY